MNLSEIPTIFSALKILTLFAIRFSLSSQGGREEQSFVPAVLFALLSH